MQAGGGYSPTPERKRLVVDYWLWLDSDWTDQSMGILLIFPFLWKNNKKSASEALKILNSGWV